MVANPTILPMRFAFEVMMREPTRPTALFMIERTALPMQI